MKLLESDTSYYRLGEKSHLLCNAIFRNISNVSFCSRDTLTQVVKLCKLANWWHHTLNQILIKYDEERYLSQFVSEMFDSLQ